MSPRKTSMDKIRSGALEVILMLSLPEYALEHGVCISFNCWSNCREGKRRTRFSPDEAGWWNYEITFRPGPNVAVSIAPDEGERVTPDGFAGDFLVAPRDEEAGAEAKAS